MNLHGATCGLAAVAPDSSRLIGQQLPSNSRLRARSPSSALCPYVWTSPSCESFAGRPKPQRLLPCRLLGALADGGFTPRELAAPAPERARTQYPRLVEYKLSFALTDLKYVGLFENPEKAVWRLAGAALETPLVATPCFDGFSRADLLNRRSAEGSGSSVLHLHGVPVADVVGDLRELSGSLGQAHALGLHVGEVLSDGASIGPFTKLPGKLA
jgi:hypothetical protein